MNNKAKSDYKNPFERAMNKIENAASSVGARIGHPAAQVIRAQDKKRAKNRSKK